MHFHIENCTRGQVRQVVFQDLQYMMCAQVYQTIYSLHCADSKSPKGVYIPQLIWSSLHVCLHFIQVYQILSYSPLLFHMIKFTITSNIYPANNVLHYIFSTVGPWSLSRSINNILQGYTPPNTDQMV